MTVENLSLGHNASDRRPPADQWRCATVNDPARKLDRPIYARARRALVARSALFREMTPLKPARRPGRVGDEARASAVIRATDSY